MIDLNTLQAAALAFGAQVIAALAVYGVFWVFARVIRGVIHRVATARRLNPDVVILLTQAVYITILIFGGITALSTLGIDITALVAGLGLTGLALGLALKDIVSNVISGVLILIYEPFKRGDHVKIGGEEGIVRAITLRYTELQKEHDRILIPNQNIFNSTVQIFNAHKV